MIYVSNAAAVEASKFLNYVRLIVNTISGTSSATAIVSAPLTLSLCAPPESRRTSHVWRAA
jgi:hypothetical protein